MFVELCMIIHQNNESVCVSACVCELSGGRALVRHEDRNRWRGLWTNITHEPVRERE